MPVLHLVSRSPHGSDALRACLARALPGAAVLLIEDGVYGALAGGEPASGLERARVSGVELYALAPDLAARGIGRDAMLEGVRVVDHEGFVSLVVRYPGVVSWW